MLILDDEIVAFTGATRVLKTAAFDALDATERELIDRLAHATLGTGRPTTVLRLSSTLHAEKQGQTRCTVCDCDTAVPPSPTPAAALFEPLCDRQELGVERQLRARLRRRLGVQQVPPVRKRR